MRNDMMDTLAAYHPTADTVEAGWPAADRARALSAILDEAPAGRPRLRFTPRRWVVAAGVATAAAAAAVVVSTTLPAGAPGAPSGAGAAALERLAVTAAAGPSIGANQFDHVLIRSMQNGTQPEDNGTWTDEYWTAADGESWYRTTRPIDPGCYHYVPSDPPGFESPTPQFLASLPTDPERLRDYIRSHVTGSTSNDEAVYVAVRDMLHTGLPSPAQRAEAFRVLTTTGHIRVSADAKDALGRPAVRVAFVDAHGRPDEVQSLYFDPRTSRIMEDDDFFRGRTFYREVTLHAGIVDSLPTPVRSCPKQPR